MLYSVLVEGLPQQGKMGENEKSPVLKDRSPLVLYRTYENCLGSGLLPTPNVRPLRRAIYVHHPVIELEHALNLARREREFSILNESEPCEYIPGINLQYLIGIYGEKIARVSFSNGEESLKANLQDEFSPRTREIYDMLQTYVLQSLQDACCTQKHRTRSRPHKNPRRV